jgi:hypothetical protein
MFASGCALDPKRFLAETNAVDTAGAFQLVPRDEFEDIDLVRLLDPTGTAEKTAGPDAWKKLSAGQKIDAALEQFYKNHPSPGEHEVFHYRTPSF